MLGGCSVVGSFQNSLSTKSVTLPLSTQGVPLVLSRQGVTFVSTQSVTLVSTQSVAFVSGQSSLLARSQTLLLPPPHAVSPRWIEHLHTDSDPLVVSMVGSFSALAAHSLYWLEGGRVLNPLQTGSTLTDHHLRNWLA